jgi:hypothetical protein
MINFVLKFYFCTYYFSPLNTIMRKREARSMRILRIWIRIPNTGHNTDGTGLDLPDLSFRKRFGETAVLDKAQETLCDGAAPGGRVGAAPLRPAVRQRVPLVHGRLRLNNFACLLLLQLLWLLWRLQLL